MRLLVRIPTASGPRTFSVPRLSAEDAALIGTALTILGGEFRLLEDGSSKTMPQIVAEKKRRGFRLVKACAGAQRAT